MDQDKFFYSFWLQKQKYKLKKEKKPTHRLLTKKKLKALEVDLEATSSPLELAPILARKSVY